MSGAIVLLHGFTGSPASWDEVVRALGTRQQILRPALTGHGAGERVASFDAEVQRLAALIDEQAGAGAHLCGYSMGGRLGLALLCRHPELFATGTILGADPGLSEEGARQERRAWQARWIGLLEEGIERFVDAWEELPLWNDLRSLDASLLERQRAIRLQHDARGLAHAMRCLDTAVMGDLRTEIASLSVPTRLVVGSGDRKFAALADEMASYSRRLRVVRLEGVGHNLPLARPTEIAHLLEPARLESLGTQL